MRERLIELMKKYYVSTAVDNGEFIEITTNWEEIADYLLAEGVIVPPVWVGSTVYYIYDLLGEWCMQEMRVTSCAFDEKGLLSLMTKSINGNKSIPFTRHALYYSLDELRFTKEEAEKALVERSK